MSKPKPLFPYIGGKTRLARRLFELFPDHHCYVEPFAGAAALFFAKEPVPVEVLNDVNGDLINLYRIVQNHLEEFLKQFKWLLTSREQFEKYRDSDTELLTDIQRAVRFLYLQKLGFGGHVDKRTFGLSPSRPRHLNLVRLEEELSAAHLRLSQCTIEHSSWEKCIHRYDRPNTLFFCDPPYWGTTGYGFEFGLDEYRKIADLALSIQGQMIITVGDCPEMRDIFTREGLVVDTADIVYNCGNKRVQTGKKTMELIIRKA